MDNKTKIKSRKLKIAFLSFFSGINDRGVETLIYEVGNRLAKKHEVVVFQAGKKQKGVKYKVVQIPTSWKNSDPADNLSVKRRFFLDRTSQAVREFTKKALPILKKEKFDVVIPWNNGWQALLTKLNRLGKMVAVGQSGLGWDDRTTLYMFPDMFVGFTDHQLSWAKKVNPFIKTAKISNGVANRFFENTETLNLDIEKPIILTVSAYTAVKRLHLAIYAVAKMKKGTLVLVGKGELEDSLKKLATRLLPGRHLFLKIEYSDPNLHKVYKTADILTFPSLAWESFGIVMLEAMASSIPVVVNDDPIRREIVGDAGLFVDPTDSEEYAKTLEKALEINWGDKPRKQAEKFSWDKIAKQYEQLFLEIS